MDATGDQRTHRVEIVLEHVRKGCQIVVVGLPGEPSELFVMPLVRGNDLSTSYGSTQRNFEQALRVMERGEIPVKPIVGDSYSVDVPKLAFEAFLASETCKPVFHFDH